MMATQPLPSWGSKCGQSSYISPAAPVTPNEDKIIVATYPVPSWRYKCGHSGYVTRAASQARQKGGRNRSGCINNIVLEAQMWAKWLW